MEGNLNGKQPHWKMTSIGLMEEDINGRQWKMTTLACLEIQFCSELGPTQPQLVFHSSCALESMTTLFYSFVRVGLIV